MRTKAGESDVKYDVPEDGASVSLKTLMDAEVEINATLSLESLTLEGDGALTLKKGEEPTAEQEASLYEHRAVIEKVAAKVHQMTAGYPLNKY